MTQSDIGIVEKLKACPFCGAEPEDCPQNSDRPHPHRKGEWCVYIWCDNCDARGPEKREAAEAIAAWNTRDPIITEMVEALEAVRSHIDATHRYGGPLLAKINALVAKVRGK